MFVLLVVVGVLLAIVGVMYLSIKANKLPTWFPGYVTPIYTRKTHRLLPVHAHTIESQLAALSERAQADGSPVPLERQFVDDRYSGATIVRPAMDRLRDSGRRRWRRSFFCTLIRPTGPQLRLSGSAHR